MATTQRNSSGRLIAIGDIHGHANALQSILDEIQPTPLDTIVTLGDCVNRGPDSRGVLDCLIELKRTCHLVPILGNHEEMMLDGRHDRFRFERWMSNGGESTLSSYGQPTCVDNIPESHWDLIASFVPFHETDDFIFTHANYCWYVPMKEQRGMELRWLSLETSEPRPHITEKIVILGHTPGVVRDAGHYRCIDTACGFGGYLTAMDVNTGHCWQVDESGKQEA